MIDQNRAPYPFAWNLIPLFGGLIDPLTGVFTSILRAIWKPHIPTRADSPKRRRRGLTFVLGGIEGPSSYAVSMIRGILRSHHRGAIELFPWNRCIPVFGALRNLVSTAHQEQQADMLVRLILRHQSDFPASPIRLLAQSGGCWILVRALEKLPAQSQIDVAVMLAPSISPIHDLSTAARRCARGLHSIGGPGDFFYLGLGTTLLGTSDRKYQPSAGVYGWANHPSGFHEIRWHPRWTRLGYLGNHTTSTAEPFIRTIVASLINNPRNTFMRDSAASDRFP